MSNIFGGKKSASESSSTNNAYPFLQDTLGGTVSNAASGSNQMADLLGLNGGDAQNAGFSKWKGSTGYQFGLDQGLQGIVGNQATKGLLNSGSTLKAMNTYGQNYADTQYGNYFNQLGSLLNSGIAGGGVLADAGKTSQSYAHSTEKESKTKFIGKLLGK